MPHAHTSQSLPIIRNARAARLIAGRGPFLKRVINAFHAFIEARVANERRRREVRVMLGLPDHILKDIGVSRGDLRSAARRHRSSAKAIVPPSGFDLGGVHEAPVVQSAGRSRSLGSGNPFGLAGAAPAAAGPFR